MSATKIHWFVSFIIGINLFVLYYRKSNNENFENRFSNNDVLSGSLEFRQQLIDDLKPEAKLDTHSIWMSAKVWDVFDAQACVGRPFQVYVHDLSLRLAGISHAQFIYDQLLLSPYSTRDLKLTCLFVYLAHAEDNLAELPFWTRDGEGLLVIFVDSLNSIVLPKRRAFFVGPHATGSQDLQVYLRVPNITQTVYRYLPKIYPFQKRNYLLNLMVSRPSKQLANYFSSALSSRIYVDLGCKGESNESMGLCMDEEYRINKLENSVFTVLSPAMKAFAQRFYECLLHGSIPVVIGNERGAYLPFAEYIQWRRAVLIFPPHYLGSIVEILSEIPVDRIIELRRNGRFYLENYLYNAQVLVRSILTAYRHRLGLIAPKEQTFKAQIIHTTQPDFYAFSQPPSKSTVDLWEPIDYYWNYNPIGMDNQLGPSPQQRQYVSDMDEWIGDQKTVNKEIKKFQKSLSGNYALDEKFTVVMTTYQRDEQVAYTLMMLNNTLFLDRVILIWNDINREVPSGLIPVIHVPIFVVNVSRNSLNNRFLPFDLIQTDAVFNMDDDFNTNLETIEFSFRIWRENRQAIVGPNFRLGYMESSNKGVYEGSNFCQQNLILTSGAFVHRIYHHCYTKLLTSEIHNHVDSLFNCEDIAINFLVSHLTRRPPIKTTPIMNTVGYKSSTGLHKRGKAHYETRSECIAKFVEVFGYNPLIISEFRADSMFYGQRRSCYTST